MVFLEIKRAEVLEICANDKEGIVDLREFKAERKSRAVWARQIAEMLCYWEGKRPIECDNCECKDLEWIDCNAVKELLLQAKKDEEAIE